MDLGLLSKLSGPEFSIDVDDEVLIFRFGENVFDYLIDLDMRESYFQIMDAIDDDPDIKVILSLFEPDCLNDEAYAKYLRKIFGADIDLKEIGGSAVLRGNVDRFRQLYFHYYTVKRRVASNKIIIDGLSGSVVTPFFGETLSADIRFASDDMRFSLAHKKYGLGPSGALAFFLPRYVGQGKAMELLLTVDYIDAEQALELGLINQIIPAHDFESRCVALGKEASKLSVSTIKSTKLLSSLYMRELDNYLEAELTLLRKSSKFPSFAR